jgi:hypothetical protein
VREVGGVWRGSDRAVHREVVEVDSFRNREVGAPLQCIRGASSSASTTSSSSSTDPPVGEAAGCSSYARSTTDYARLSSDTASFRAIERD